LHTVLTFVHFVPLGTQKRGRQPSGLPSPWICRWRRAPNCRRAPAHPSTGVRLLVSRK